MCADIVVHSLQVAVRMEAHGRKRCHLMCRCITFPVRTGERLRFNASGQLTLKLKSLRFEGTAHLGVLPLEFMQWLDAPVVDTNVGRETPERRPLRGGQFRLSNARFGH